MSRLAVLLVIGLVVLNAASALFAKSVPSRRAQSAGSEITLIYVAAKNCAPCDTWDRDHRAAFVGSPQYKKITYHEVIAPALKEVLSDDSWPIELRRYRDTAKNLAGAPTWILVERDRVIATMGGLSKWADKVQPYLKRTIR